MFHILRIWLTKLKLLCFSKHYQIQNPVGLCLWEFCFTSYPYVIIRLPVDGITCYISNMPDEYITRTLNAYNADPKKYEDATGEMILHEEIEEFMSRTFNKSLPVLDAGCAFGRDTALLAKNGFKVKGIDMSDGLLERARELYPNLSFQKMDVRKLEFPDESFSGVWCNATLLHLTDEDMQTALEEFKRVLIPGGVVFMSFKEGDGEEELVEKFSSNSARYYKYHTTETVRKLVEESGLKVVRIYTINEREKWGADKRDLNWVYCFAVR